MHKFTVLPLLLLVLSTIIIGIPKVGSFSKIMSNERETDRVALLAIQSKNMYPDGYLVTYFNKLVDFCLWEGVTCDRLHKRVTGFNFAEMDVTGTLSSFVGNLTFLRDLILHNNTLSGLIPPQLGRLNRLQTLDLGSNNLTGTIPEFIGNFKHLKVLDLGGNSFTGKIPSSLYKLFKLRTLSLASNLLEGTLPPGLGFFLLQLLHLDISNNSFTGSLPTTLGQCVALSTLFLSSNSFIGFIPSSFSFLKSLQAIDLSNNKLSGQLPAYFYNFSLVLLNLSFNNLEGDVPNGGVFADLSATKLLGNSKLCGGNPQFKLPSCPKTKSNIMVVSISCVLLGLMILCPIILLLSRRRRRRHTSSPSEGVQLKEPFTKVSYAMLLKATNGFSTKNLIGLGSYGSVYKGALFLDGEEQIVAIKTINNQHQGASKSFTAECKALRTIRHRNLVRVITACSSIDYQGNVFQALVYELMPKGSLERWLYSNPEEDGQVLNLTLLQRLNIAIDVAHALDYLHNGNHTPIIHCDLKPTNILLDEDMSAHVGDFVLVRFLQEVSEQLYSISSIGVRGTLGYVASEYGLGSSVSTVGDVYSYGIILLELITAKKPTDLMFEGGMNLQNFVESALPERLLEIVDPKLGVDDHDDDNQEICINSNDTRGSVSKCVFECITSMIMTGLRCSSELPRSRMEIKEVIFELHSQRDRLLLCGRHRCQFIL